MKEQDVKKAFELAQNELEDKKEQENLKQIAEVKEIVKRTLEEIEVLKGKKSNIDEKLKILKLDIEDLKNGKLERIKERQDKDPKAKKISIIIIKQKEPTVPTQSSWYQPYYIKWNTQQYPRDNQIFCDDESYTYSNNSGSNDLRLNTVNTNNTIPESVACNYNSVIPNVVEFKLTNSIVKNNTIGTYQVAKKIIHLR